MDARRALVTFKNKVNDTNTRLLRNSLRFSLGISLTKQKLVQEDVKKTKSRCMLNPCDVLSMGSDGYCSQSLSRFIKKCRGGKNLQPPPAMDFSQSLLTLVGAFTGLLTLSLMNELVKLFSNGMYKIM